MNEKEFEKKYGDAGILMDASLLIDEARITIPLTPALDVHLHGGIMEGTTVLLSGKEGTGKTSTALRFAANAQKKEYGGRKIIYDDVEHRLKKSTLDGIYGLDYSDDKLTIIRSTKEKILTAEDHLNIVLDLIKSVPNAVFIIDSTSALCGAGEMIEDVKSDGRNSGPKLLANFCRHIAPLVLLNKQIVILTQHMIADTSGKGIGGYHEDGGSKIKHQADIKMRIKYTDKWVSGSGENEKRIGQILHWQIVKSPYGPIDKIDSYLRYGYGPDNVWEIVNLACDIGLISKGGAGWYTLSFLNEPEKLQGQEKVHAYLIENQAIYNILYEKVQEALN